MKGPRRLRPDGRNGGIGKSGGSHPPGESVPNKQDNGGWGPQPEATTAYPWPESMLNSLTHAGVISPSPGPKPRRTAGQPGRRHHPATASGNAGRAFQSSWHGSRFQPRSCCTTESGFRARSTELGLGQDINQIPDFIIDFARLAHCLSDLLAENLGETLAQPMDPDFGHIQVHL